MILIHSSHLLGSAWYQSFQVENPIKNVGTFARRTPIIAATKGAEGLDVQHNEHLLLADTPEGFTEQSVRLLNDKNLRQRLL